MGFVETVSIVGYCIEAIGVIVVVIGSLASSYRYVATVRNSSPGQAYETFRQQLGRSIILGLEFLIAGDIVRTVVVADSLESVATLGLIILIRTFLSLTLFLETEGRLPWQEPKKEAA